MKYAGVLIFSASLFLLATNGIGEQKTVESKAPRAEKTLPASSVSNVGGFIGERLRLSEQNRLLKFDIEQFIRMVEQPKQAEWWWIGEQPGKWIEAAILDSQVSGNDATRKKAAEMLRRFVAAQDRAVILALPTRKFARRNNRCVAWTRTSSILHSMPCLPPTKRPVTPKCLMR
jgi:hypothetical protein